MSSSIASRFESSCTSGSSCRAASQPAREHPSRLEISFVRAESVLGGHGIRRNRTLGLCERQGSMPMECNQSSVWTVRNSNWSSEPSTSFGKSRLKLQRTQGIKVGGTYLPVRSDDSRPMKHVAQLGLTQSAIRYR